MPGELVGGGLGDRTNADVDLSVLNAAVVVGVTSYSPSSSSSLYWAILVID